MKIIQRTFNPFYPNNVPNAFAIGLRNPLSGEMECQIMCNLVFMELSRRERMAIYLHEMAHIRLGHLDELVGLVDQALGEYKGSFWALKPFVLTKYTFIENRIRLRNELAADAECKKRGYAKELREILLQHLRKAKTSRMHRRWLKQRIRALEA